MVHITFQEIPSFSVHGHAVEDSHQAFVQYFLTVHGNFRDRFRVLASRNQMLP